MKLSIFFPFGLKTPIHASKNWGFGGISPPKCGEVSTKPTKCTFAGRSRSSGVLIIFVSAIFSEKSRGNKKCDEEEEEEKKEEKRHILALLASL